MKEIILKHGNKGNMNGRPKGSRNKANVNLRKAITEFVSHNVVTLQKDYDKLRPAEKLTLLEKLLRYALPPLTSIDVTSTVRHEIASLPDEQLKALADKVLALNEQNNIEI